MNISSKIRLRQDSSANWLEVNPVLDIGEPAFEVDTGKLKLGNGNSHYNDLPYLESEGSKWFVQNTIPVDMKENDLWLVSESFDSYNSGDVYEYIDSNWKYKSNIQGKSGVDGKDALVYTKIYENDEEPAYNKSYVVDKSNFNRDVNLEEYFNLTFKSSSGVYSCICMVNQFPNETLVGFQIESFTQINGLNIITLKEGNIDRAPSVNETLEVNTSKLDISVSLGQSACWALNNSTNDEKYLTTGTFTAINNGSATYTILSVQSLTSSDLSSNVETIENTNLFLNMTKLRKCKKFEIQFPDVQYGTVYRYDVINSSGETDTKYPIFNTYTSLYTFNRFFTGTASSTWHSFIYTANSRAITLTLSIDNTAKLDYTDYVLTDKPTLSFAKTVTSIDFSSITLRKLVIYY